MGVRLQDVADRAGVSMKTVSNVVRGHPHVSDRMRTRVQSAIDELGYVPNMTARRLATGRTGTIALAVPALGVPYFAELAEAVSAIAEQRDYRVLIEQTASGAAAERRAINGRERGLVDGVILQPTQLTSVEIASVPPDLPVVLLGEMDPPPGVDHVMIDNFAGAGAATRHLIERGRRRIAFLGHERSYRSNTYSQRLLGYQAELGHEGLPAHPDLLLRAADFGAAAGELAINQAVAAGLRFDGIVCYDDLTAIGALRGLRTAGLSVPEDVAVVGWDDIHLAQFVDPPLTTVVADKTAIVSRAVDLLMERIEGYVGPGRHEVLPFDLAVRASSG